MKLIDRVIFVSLMFLIGFLFIYLLHRIDIIEKKVDRLNIDTLKVRTHFDDTTYKPTYNYILPKIIHFNDKADTNAIKCIAKVMHHYKLDKTKKVTIMFIGQILQESGVNQYYCVGPLTGQLVVSCTGAIGISQILPSTALSYLSNSTEKEKKEMTSLGCTDFNFVNKKTWSNKDKIKDWLMKKENNIILWGYIVHDMFSKNKDINKTLLAYNIGEGGLKMYLDSGNVVTDHEYIISIKNRVNGLSK